MKSLWIIVATLGVVFACSMEPVRMPSVESHPLPSPARTPFDLTLEYTSELNDPYYVTSGPAESYARYPISAQFRALIERQTAALSTPGSPRRATLSVRVTTLTTRYDQLGAAPTPHPPTGPRYGSMQQHPTVVPATFLAEYQMDGNSNIPEEIRKGATLTAAVELHGDGFAPVQQTVRAVHDDVIVRWDYSPLWAYNYTEVLDLTLRAATAEITAVVQATLK